MMQVTPVHPPQCQPITIQPSYNAVKIDINNPQVNAPCNAPPAQSPVTAPIYSYPSAPPIYEMPQQSVYQPKQQPVSQPPAVKETPTVPPPVIVQPTISQTPTEPVAAPVVPATPAVVPIVAPAITPVVPIAPAAQAIEVKAPEVVAPQLDLNEFINKLTSPDYEVQATAMEAIADLAQNSPQKATELLDVRVIDTLLNIMQTDTSKLTGPSAQQIEIRGKILEGKPVTEAETAEANKITPMEQAERNKQYSIYTVAILQKLYASEIEKINNIIVPLTELPGAAGIVEQVKNNPNPIVRASAINALSYIQRPEYKQDLTTLFTVAQKDKDVNVQQTATKALEKLAQVADAPVAAPVAAPATEPAAAPATAPVDAKSEDKKAA